MENRGEVSNELSEEIKQKEATPGRLFDRISQKWQSLTPEQRVYYTQLGLLFATQAVDVFTTYAGFKTNDGTMEEKGAISRALLDSGGFGALTLLKASGAAGMATLFEGGRRMLKTEPGPWLNLPLRLVNTFNTGLSLSNTAYITGLL